uniref:phycobilisome degradation protein n=1 Tax=Ahnfeltia fastigiata TaxID=31363 RepID=UPI001D12C199|nr:phycobilisome degradation protein [Ahnfeltia fastigiata]UAT97698.1 phycobilisome degradation protein [Ahnfeltia fastigiata]
MNSGNELTLEQEFKLEIYRKKVQKLSEGESRKYLIATLKQMMIKDNVIKYFIKNSGL